MTIGEAVGVKKNLGYGTYLLDVRAKAFVGQTVTVTDADGEVVASKVVPESGKVKIPVEECGTLYVSTDGAVTQRVKATYYGTYKVALSDRVLYTLRITAGDSNPDSRCAYFDDCEGFAPARMDYSTGQFDYGSWEGAFFMPKPCMVETNGTIDYFLDPDDYTKKEDGTPSDVKNLSYDGNAMMAFPTVWTRHWEDGLYRYVQVTNKAADGFHCYAHHDHNGDVMPYTFMRIYEGHVASGKMRSISGVSPTTNNNATNERTYAQANGAEMWDIGTLADWILLTDLCWLVGKSTDSQTAFGTGRCKSSNTASIQTGTMDNKGLFWGSDDEVQGVKAFGMENPWGNVWERTVGLINSASRMYAKLTYGKEDGTTVEGYAFSAAGMLDTGIVVSGTSGGFVSESKALDYGILPVKASGSQTTCECDGLWFSTSAGTYVAFVGGDWFGAGRAGVSCVYLNYAASYAGSAAGASLSCKPPAAA